MEDNKKKKGLYFFITKPRFAMVISIFITIVGLVSMFGLQLEKYPNITPPQVVVSASYPGASAAVIESSVASILETQVNGVENMLYMTSTSYDEAYQLNVFFKVGTNKDINLVDWLRQFSPQEQAESFIRGWLGRMLFSGEESLKKSNVLSGGEKVRCLFAKLMLEGPNVLVLEDPTNHLDLESITALNEGMSYYKGNILFTSHDAELLDTVANRYIYISGNKFIDKETSYDEFMDLIES